MRKTFLLLAFCCWIKTSSIYATEKLGILISKKSVLSFESDIVDVDIDVNDNINHYFFKIKGKNLLLRAKSSKAPAATLFVRYGKDKHSYVAEIFPDDKAPLHRIIQTSDVIKLLEKPLKQTRTKQPISNGSVFAPNEKQQYTWFAVDEGGVTVMVSNIMHGGKSTYLRIYINNKTTVNLKLSHCNFEYITLLKKFFFFTSEQRNRVTPLLAPINLELAPMSFDYFDFSIPTYASDGGLEILLGESENGIRKYKINIPSKVLLQAPRK